MSRSLTRSSSARRSTARRSCARIGRSSIRLSSVLKSGILSNRGKILDLMADNSSVQSRTLLEINPEGQKMLEIFNLKFLYSSLFATILENSIMELKILGSCNNTLDIIETQCDTKRLRSAKFGVVQVHIVDELEGIDRKMLDKEEYKLKKLAADRQFFQDTMFMTYADLSLNNSFESLAQQIAFFHDRDKHRETLTAEEECNRINRRELARQLRQQRNHILSANYDVDVVIDKLRAQVEDSNIDAEFHSRYIGRWQRSREEQHEATLADTVAAPLENMRLYKHRIDGEHRVHNDVMLLINMDINETIDKVDQAMNKYDIDMEEVELQIQIMKNNYQKQVEIRKEAQDKYKRQEKDMNEWQAFKESREDARLYRERMAWAAVVVQAWWRGILVRQQLGPYKPVMKPRRPNK